jgi:hypothetical protein
MEVSIKRLVSARMANPGGFPSIRERFFQSGPGESARTLAEDAGDHKDL